MWIKRWCIIRITKCFLKNNSVQINHSPVYAHLFFFRFSLNISIWNQDATVVSSRKDRKIRFSRTPLNPFSQLIECFHGGQWPLSIRSAFCFPWSGTRLLVSSETRSLLLWIDLRRHGTLNAASRHPSTPLRPPWR